MPASGAEAEVFLVGEAVYLMKDEVADADLQDKNATFITPKDYAEHIVAADKVVNT